MDAFSPSKEDAAEVFSSFAVCTEFLSRVFIATPDEDFIERLVAQNLFSEWPLPGREAMSEGLRLMHRFCQAWKTGSISGLIEEYTRLFLGPEKALVPPYESLYTGKEGIIFDEGTIDVREYYRRCSLRVERLNREPDDHVAVELAFISFLCKERSRAEEQGQETLAQKSGETLERFLSQHMMKWIGSFLDLIQKHARSDYYSGTGCLARGTIDMLAECLAWDPEKIV